MSRGYLNSTVITSAIHQPPDINVPSRRSVGNISDVIHVGTREQSSEWYSGWRPEDRYGDDRRLLTLPNRCAKGNIAEGMYARGTGSARLTATCNGPVSKRMLRWTAWGRTIVRGQSEPFGTVARARLLATSNSNTRGGRDHALRPAVMSYAEQTPYEHYLVTSALSTWASG